jgi:hypothetical protein
VQTADDPRTDGCAQAKWVADDHDRLANRCLVAVAEFESRQRMTNINLDYSYIEHIAGGDQPGIPLRSVSQGNGNAERAVDNVLVGSDQARGIDDEPGSHSQPALGGSSPIRNRLDRYVHHRGHGLLRDAAPVHRGCAGEGGCSGGAQGQCPT